MKISDFDIYHLPPLMGMFVDYIENECERLLQESPQFTELQREDHTGRIPILKYDYRQ